MKVAPHGDPVTWAALHTRSPPTRAANAPGSDASGGTEAHCRARGWTVGEVFEDYADLRVMPT